MVNNFNSEEAKEYIRSQIIRSHPSRAKNTDEYYDTIASEAAARMLDEFTVRKLVQERARDMVTAQVNGLARSGNTYLRKCNDGLNDALIHEPGVGSYLIKVPVFEEGRERPIFWNVRLARATKEDLLAWAQWEERKANEDRDTRLGGVHGARNLVKHLEATDCANLLALQRRTA